MKTRFPYVLPFVLPVIFFLIVSTVARSTAAPEGTTQYLYLPLVIKPEPFKISGFEVTQAVQNINNTVPLVTDRPTAVRVFTQGDAPNKTITLSATRSGIPLGSVVVGPKSAITSQRSDLNSSFNFILPANWLSDTIVMTASDGEGATDSITVTFNDVPQLNIVIVPVNYTHSPTGQTFAGPTNDNISDWLMRAYPVDNVNVTVRSAISFTGNLGDFFDWSALQGEINFTKGLDGAAPSTIYFGLVTRDCAWFTCGGGFVGIGGGRTAVALDYGPGDTSGSLAGHEIGHGLGRAHIPCGVTGEDTGFPYPDGSIGEFGLDGILSGSLALLNPDTYKDMMGYCDPDWVSDYTYEALYQDQISNGAFVLGPMSDSLLIRGQFQADGSFVMQPVYRVPQAAQTAVSNDYLIQLLAADGTVVVQQLVDVLVVEEAGEVARSIQTAVPLPEQPFTTVRLLEVASGTVLAERQLTAAYGRSDGQVSPSIEWLDDRAVLRWRLADVLAVVRYSVDGGESWTALAINVLGGELDVDITALPTGESGRFQIILADSLERISIE